MTSFANYRVLRVYAISCKRLARRRWYTNFIPVRCKFSLNFHVVSIASGRGLPHTLLPPSPQDHRNHWIRPFGSISRIRSTRSGFKCAHHLRWGRGSCLRGVTLEGTAEATINCRSSSPRTPVPEGFQRQRRCRSVGGILDILVRHPGLVCSRHRHATQWATSANARICCKYRSDVPPEEHSCQCDRLP